MKRCAWLLTAAITVTVWGDEAATRPARTKFSPASMAYVLQANKISPDRAKALSELAASGRDLIVLYPFFSGRTAPWTKQDLDGLRQAKPGRKVLAYLSIGEATDDMLYWRKDWVQDGKLTAAAPKWLVEEDEYQHGCYVVRYWHTAWKMLLTAMLDDIIAQGFDGVLLNGIDVYMAFEYDPATDHDIANRVNGETKRTYRQDMIDWVGRLATYARKQAGEGFLIVPLNATAMLADNQYLDAIDAVCVEDVFTDGDKKQIAGLTKRLLKELSPAQKAGKTVLLMEFGTNPFMRHLAIQGAAENNMVLLLAPEDYGGLGEANPSSPAAASAPQPATAPAKSP